LPSCANTCGRSCPARARGNFHTIPYCHSTAGPRATSVPAETDGRVPRSADATRHRGHVCRSVTFRAEQLADITRTGLVGFVRAPDRPGRRGSVEVARRITGGPAAVGPSARPVRATSCSHMRQGLLTTASTRRPGHTASPGGPCPPHAHAEPVNRPTRRWAGDIVELGRVPGPWSPIGRPAPRRAVFKLPSTGRRENARWRAACPAHIGIGRLGRRPLHRGRRRCAGARRSLPCPRVRPGSATAGQGGGPTPACDFPSRVPARRCRRTSPDRVLPDRAVSARSGLSVSPGRALRSLRLEEACSAPPVDSGRGCNCRHRSPPRPAPPPAAEDRRPPSCSTGVT